MAIAPSFELIGRDRELARLVDFAARLREGPAGLLIRGEPGIGKTVLWREGSAAAQREGVRVLVSRCAEAEMPIPLGAVSDLLDPAFAEVADELASPQRHALSAALGIETDAVGRPDRLTLLRALVAAFHALASDGPLLLTIDDVQWLDPASARVLSFAVRRIGDESIGVLATLRGGADEPDPLGLAERVPTGNVRGAHGRAPRQATPPAASASAVRRPHSACEGRRYPRRVARQPDVRPRVRTSRRA